MHKFFSLFTLIILIVFASCGTEPLADFDIASSEKGKVSFRNSSENATRFMWYFGDGETSIRKDPEHTYEHNGIYTVALTAESNGRRNTTYKELVIEDNWYMSCDFRFGYLDATHFEAQKVNAYQTEDSLIFEGHYTAPGDTIIVGFSLRPDPVTGQKHQIEYGSSPYRLWIKRRSQTGKYEHTIKAGNGEGLLDVKEVELGYLRAEFDGILHGPGQYLYVTNGALYYKLPE